MRILLLVIAVWASGVSGATQYFSDAGGPKTWNGVNANWGNASGGPYASLWTDNNDAVFQGTGGSVTVNGSRIAGSLTFAVTGYTLSGGTITLSNSTGDWILWNAGGFDVVINSDLVLSSPGGTGFGGAIKYNRIANGSDPSTITLGGAISDGGNGYNLGFNSGDGTGFTGPLTIFNGATANTYTGNTLLYQGARVRLQKSDGITAIPGNLEIRGFANGFPALELGANNQIADTAVVSFTGTTWGYFQICGFSETVGGLSCASLIGVVENGAVNHFINTGGTLTLDVADATAYTFSGLMRNADVNGGTGVLNLVKTGTGTQVLSGASIIHSGMTTVSGGRLKLVNTTGYASTTTINSSGILEINLTADWRINNGLTLAGSGVLLKTGVNALALGGNASGAHVAMSSGGAIDVQAGCLINDFANGDWSQNLALLNLANTGSLDMRNNNVRVDALTGNGSIHDIGFPNTLTIGVNNTSNNAAYSVTANTATFSGVIGADGISVVKVGLGTQVFSGASSYTNGTTINGGVLRLSGGPDRLPASGAVTIGSGTATFDVNGQTQAIGVLSGANGGTLALGAGALTVAQVADTTFTGVVTGSGSLSKSGAGTLTLGGASTYSGGTTLNDGMLLLAGAAGSALGTGDLTITSGANLYSKGVYLLTDQSSGVIHFNADGYNYVRANGRTWTVAGLDCPTITANSGVIENGGLGRGQANSGTVVANIGIGVTCTYAGEIRNADVAGGTGVLNLVKTGTGTQVLNGATITHSGMTTVSGGRLKLVNTTGYASTTTINSAGTLEINLTADWRINNGLTLAGSGVLLKTGANQLVLGGNASGAHVAMSSGGAIDVQAGCLINDYANGDWSQNLALLNLANTGSLDMRNNNVRVDALTGNGSIHDVGFPNTLTLGVNNTSNNAAYSVADNTATFSGVIGADGISVVKVGLGTQVFSGASSYTGGTTVSGGVLLVNNASGSATGTGTLSVSGGTLGGTGTANGAVTLSAGGAVAPGLPGSVGTLTVASLTGGAGTIRIDLKDTNGDVLNMTGTANVQGMALALTGTWTPITTFTVMRANGGLSGRFASLPGSGSCVTNEPTPLYINYYADSVELSPVSGQGTVYTIR